MLQLSSDLKTRRYQLAALVGLPLLGVFWAYWTTLGEVASAWSSNPQYSHGFLVPIFAIALLWLRRDRIDLTTMSTNWWGMALIVLSIGQRLAGAYFHYTWIDRISLLPCLVGVTLLLGGKGAWRWSWPAILFLFFMIPLPYSVATSMSGPLQKIATVTSTYALQTFGLPALAEGNVILIDDARIGIVEACSGLRMLVVFFALSTAMVLIVKRPIADRILLILSAVPIAIIANVIRVTITGLLHVTVENSEVADVFFHDVAGWLMMPLALGILWVELKILSKLFIESGSSTMSTRNPSRTAPMARSRRRNRQESADKPTPALEPEAV